MDTAMRILKNEMILIQNEQDVVMARRRAGEFAVAVGFTLLAKTKLVTAASELARNVLVHAGNGSACFQLVESNNRRGIQIIFEDRGPGIADIELAMQEGYSSRGSLGMGLCGSKRLVSEFKIASTPGTGTCVSILIWK
jgi:serine/threonine-protein kinase RsbT